MSDMADVLAKHQDIAWDHTTGNALCGGCGVYLGQLTADMMKQDAWLIAHQAAALSAAGFGLVQEARAEAWDEGCSFGSLYDHTFRSDNPYRTEASS